MSAEWWAASACLALIYLMGIAFPQFRVGRLLQLAAVAVWTAGRAIEAFEAALAAGLAAGVRALRQTARDTWREGLAEVGRG